VDPPPQLLEVELEAAPDRVEAEVEELAEDRGQREPLRLGDSGGRRDEQVRFTGTVVSSGVWR